jgi:hypothetical protein
MNKSLLPLILLSVFPCFAHAQTAIPAGNPTQFPTGPAEWTITVKFKDSAGTKEGRLQKVDVTQAGDIQRLILTWLSGKTTEQWHFSKELVTLTTNSVDGKPVCIPDYEKLLWLPTGFEPSSFAWVDRSNYKDTVSYQGKTCYHYLAHVKLGRDRVFLGQDSEGHGDQFEAWIDKKSLLPVGLDDGIKIGVFSFMDTPPPGPLTPPPAIAEAFRRNTAILMPVKSQ